MSNTSPKNQDALTSGYRPPTATRQPRTGDEAWRMISQDGALLTCELFDDSHVGAGWEVALRKGGELILGRRCATRAIADDVADTFRQDHLRTGWRALETDRRKDLI